MGLKTRTALKAVGFGLLILALALGALALTADTASASVESDSLAVGDGFYSGDGAEVYSPVLVTEGQLRFAVDETPDEWTVTLAVAPAGTDDWATLDTQSGGAISPSMALDYRLKGPLVDHPAFNTSAFDPPRNTTASHDLDVRVTLTVVQDGEPVVTATATDTTTVEIQNTLDALEASLADGDGYWLFWEDAGDAEPTTTP